MESVDPNKYIVFKREDFAMWLGTMSTQDLRDVVVPSLWAEIEHLALPDAVVIRRQDLFAGPALHSYASSISIASKLNADPDLTKGLQGVADYFHDQAVLADEEGWKLPD